MASLLQGYGRIRSRNGVICPFSIPSGVVLVTGKDRFLHVDPVGEAREDATNLPQAELNTINIIV